MYRNAAHHGETAVSQLATTGVLEKSVLEKRPLPATSPTPKPQQKPPQNVVANMENPRGGKSPRVVANPEVARGGKSKVAVVEDDDDDDDDEIVTTKPKSNARIEIAARKRDKGKVFVLRWRWQKQDVNGEPLRTASGGYKRGSKYVTTVESEAEAKRIRKRLT